MNFSFWEKSYAASAADITIVGSGIVGVSTAISIKSMRPDLKVKVIDRAPVSYGASTKNAGFACFGSVSELLDDIKAIGEDACAEIVNMRWQGLQLLRRRVSDDRMKYKSCGGIEVFSGDGASLAYSCFDRMSYCNNFIKHTTGLADCYAVIKNSSYSGFHHEMIFNQYEGSLHPVLMMHHLINMAKGLEVQFVNGVSVLDIDFENKQLHCEGDLAIPYNKLCVCTNGFTKNLFKDIEVVPARNQVVMTRPIQDLKLEGCYHFDRGYFYFRNFENRILLGGARNVDFQNEFTDEPGITEPVQHALKMFLDKIHPGASQMIEHRWSGTLGVGFSKVPICRWQDDHIIIGVRLGGMGVAIGSWLGEKLAGMICERL